MNTTHYTLVQIDAPHVLAGNVYWQATAGDGEEARLLGLFDDDGDPVTVGNATWTALRDDLAPPFDC
jgi:hypothetical protein